jgi:hypothetical protein
MIKNFYLFENTLFSGLRDYIDNTDELQKLIGFNDKDYKLTIIDNRWQKIDFILSFRERFLTDFLDLDDSIFNLYFNVNSVYDRYEVYVDDSEINYIDRYLNDENINKLNLFLDYLDINKENNSEYLYDVFRVIGEDYFDYDDIKIELSYEWENAIRQNFNDVVEKFPFNIEYCHRGNFDVDLEFSIDKIGEYIQDNKLEVNTIKEFLSNVDMSDFCYELSDHWESDYNIDYSGVNKEFEKEIDKLLDRIDINQPKFEDPTQLKLFNDDDYEELKTKKKYKFDYDFFIQLDIDNLHFAKRAGGKLIAWFESYIFQKNYMKNEDVKKYEHLVENDIVHPKIVEEYEHLVYATKYNL